MHGPLQKGGRRERPYYEIQCLPDKNHEGGLGAIGQSHAWTHKVFQHPTAERYCAVATIDLYLSHCPPCDSPTASHFYLAINYAHKTSIWYKRQHFWQKQTEK